MCSTSHYKTFYSLFRVTVNYNWTSWLSQRQTILSILSGSEDNEGAVKMAQLLGAQADLPEDSGSVPTTHMLTKLSIMPVPGDPTPSVDQANMWYTDIHVAITSYTIKIQRKLLMKIIKTISHSLLDPNKSKTLYENSTFLEVFVTWWHVMGTLCIRHRPSEMFKRWLAIVKVSQKGN